MESKKCGHPDCNIETAGNNFACTQHFDELPKHIKTEIFKSHSAKNGARLAAVHELAKEYWEYNNKN